jgi:hypothetical protein
MPKRLGATSDVFWSRGRRHSDLTSEEWFLGAEKVVACQVEGIGYRTYGSRSRGRCRGRW